MTNLFKEFKKLVETQIIRVPDETSLTGKTSILKNPSLDDYINFKSNTKYNAVRGLGINNDIYVIDANSGIHAYLAVMILENLGYDITNINVEDYITGSFSEDEFDNFSCQFYGENKKLEELNKNRKHVNSEDENYFDLELEYKNYEIENCDRPNFLSFEDWLKSYKRR